MKQIIYMMTLSVLLFTGCSKHPAAPEAPEQYDRYIFFSQGVETKASLIEKVDNLNGQKFGVVGFKYQNTSTWDAVKATATPNVFFRDDNQPVVGVEECSVEGTSASYSPLQGWSNSKRYTFFAYYPLENQYVTLVNLDGEPYSAGVPAIKYTMSTTDPSASMVDVMTAPAHLNLDGSNSQVTNDDVEFNFQHRLSCLGLNIKNSSAGNITIKSVKFDITGIRYSSSILFFDGTSKPLPENGQAWSVEDISLDVSSESAIVPGANDGKGDELSDKLIFIPQANNISIRIKVDYTREVDGYIAVDDTFSTTNLTTDLEEGKKHLVHLNFTDSTVDVTGQISSEGWVKIPDVTNSFN